MEDKMRVVSKEKSTLQTKDVVLCGLFIALNAVGAFIKVPVPVVPFTLQFLFTMLAGLILGSRLGAVAVAGYTILGLVGLPIFAEGGGLWYVLKPSFGYMLGFIAGAYVTGYIVEKKGTSKISTILMANFAGLFIVYFVGMVYYYIISNFVINNPIALWPLILYCFLLAVPGDICLCILGAFIAKRLRPMINKI